MEVIEEHLLDDGEDSQVQQEAGQGRQEGREVCTPHDHGTAAGLHEGHAEHQLVNVHHHQALHGEERGSYLKGASMYHGITRF